VEINEERTIKITKTMGFKTRLQRLSVDSPLKRKGGENHSRPTGEAKRRGGEFHEEGLGNTIN